MDESQSDKLQRKMREAPFLPIGLAGFVGALGYGAYKFKHRGDMSVSFYLVQLRVISQSVVVGALMVGMVLTTGKKLLNHFSSKSEG